MAGKGTQVSPLLAIWSSLNLDAAEEVAAEGIKEKVLPLLQEGAGGGDAAAEAGSLKESDIDDVFSKMEPRAATVPWIVAMNSRYSTKSTFDTTEFFALAGRLFKEYSAAQAKLVPEAFASLIRLVVDTSNAMNEPTLSLQPLLDAALGFSETHDTLSPAHSAFVIQSLRAKTYDPADALLAHPLTNFDSKHGVNYRDHLAYHYYGGQLLIHTRQYARAHEMLSVVYCTPTMNFVASALQVAAYKKIVLLELVVYGKRGVKPKAVSEYVANICRTLAQPYNFLGQAFETGDAEIASMVWGQVKSYFKNDGNEALAMEAASAVRKHKIRKLRKTFITVPLSYVVELDHDITGAGPDTRSLILEMIENGELSASLSADDPEILRFTDTPLTDGNLDALLLTLEKVRKLNSQLAQADRKVGMSRQFLQLKQQSGGMASSAGAYNPHMVVPEYDGIGEEDVLMKMGDAMRYGEEMARRVMGGSTAGRGAGRMDMDESFNQSIDDEDEESD
ncbi:hypothetical protein BZA70DRAFT_289044 [Myxozyma melibiosi]|uniref:COP9 signalosome complex subunit 3 N-terminal helical repeats domain-containing protein n=1 Tax=Myxozyma melibiosi TaxID=54550 RepID=A0ABR1F7N3_9ASCO